MIIYKSSEKQPFCGFTDIKYYEGNYYVCFRIGKEHMYCHSQIVVMKSKDTKKWEEYSKTQTTDDLRDPRFTIEGNKLYILVNYCDTKNDKVIQHLLLRGRVRPGYTFLAPTWKNMFVSSVYHDDYDYYITYDPIKNGNTKCIVNNDYNISIPSFPDSTEGTMFVDKGCEKYFFRRDEHNNYWVVFDFKKKEFTIKYTEYRIHCPLLIENGKYMLGREMKKDQISDPHDWWEVYKNASLCLYKVNGYKLEKITTFEGGGDCGYFGYDRNLMSYYAIPDKANHKEMAIYVESIRKDLK